MKFCATEILTQNKGGHYNSPEGRGYSDIGRGYSDVDILGIGIRARKLISM